MCKLLNNQIITRHNLTVEFSKFQNSETFHHTNRVSNHAELLAQKIGMKKEESKKIAKIAPYHDFGKMVIPEEVLYKESKLTNEEFSQIKSHAIRGYEILKGHGNDFLDECAIVARDHHEKWDGSGYPNGLKGNQIDIKAQVVAGADCFDALVQKRAYKRAWSDEEIKDFFKSGSGSHFNPLIADTIVENFDLFLEIDRNSKII